MASSATLRQFVATLQQAEIVCQPDGETWAERIERISRPGCIAEITEEDYDYWLEVLPPKYQGHGFSFAEGAEPLRYFWTKDDRFFCRQLTWDETKQFCTLAKVPFPYWY